MRILFEENDEVFLNEFNYQNSCSYDELSSVCPVKHQKYNGQELKKDKLNIICGSFYMISQMITK